MKPGLALLDDTDRALVAALRRNARDSAANIARRLGVARTTVLAPIARLEAAGVIAGYTVRLGPVMGDGAIEACVGLEVTPKAGREVVRRLEKVPEVTLACAVSGGYDYVAWLRAESPSRLDAILDEIGAIEGVTRTTTSVVLARRIDRSANPLVGP
jgi:DNA-binding Lrp family transcriptional regulator